MRCPTITLCYVNSSFQDVSFKWDQMVVGKIGDICFCLLIAHICFHWQKLYSILIPGNKTNGRLHEGQDLRFCVNGLHEPIETSCASTRSEQCSSKNFSYLSLVLCEIPRGMCSSFASYTHPGKEELHRHTSCAV